MDNHAVRSILQSHPELENDIKDIDLDDETLELLEKLASYSQQESRRSHVEEQEMERQTAEYQAEIAKRREQLALTGIIPEQLPAKALADLDTIAEGMSLLGLSRPTDNSALAVWGLLHGDTLKLRRKRFYMERAEQQLQRALQLAQTRCQELACSQDGCQGQLAGKEKEVEASRVKLTDFHSKIEAYRDRKVKIQEVLRNSRFTDELRHSKLLEQQHHLDEARLQLAARQEALKQYLGLPGSIVGAELMVQQAQQQAQQLQNKLDAKLADMY